MPNREAESFLPPDGNEEQLFNQVKAETAEQWKKDGEPGRQRDYVYRYASARLFQLLREARRRKSYAGFQNLVHLSSGVIRDFLEPCYLMFDACVAKGDEPKDITHIPPAIQNEIIYKYSEDFLLVLFEDIRKDLPPEKWTQVEELRTLLESLGRLFYNRLHDPKSREARLFSFTVRGRVSAEMEDVLNMGVRNRYFLLRTYSTKEGGGREKWYILNRRLCPMFKLDPTGFEGRISLTPKLLAVALKNPDEFVKMRLKQPEELPQTEELPLFEKEGGTGDAEI